MRATVIAVALFILHVVSLLAQPVVGGEILSQPIPPRNDRLLLAAPAVAMARDQGGVAIAWSMRNASGDERIFVGRLDAIGQLRDQAVEVPLLLSDAGVDAVYPSIARSETGSGFTLGWIELFPAPSSASEAVYCRLDADLKPSAPRALASRFLVAGPTIVRSAAETWLTSDGLLFRLAADGSVADIFNGGAAASDMAVADSSPQLVSGLRNLKAVDCKQPCAGMTAHFFCPESCEVFQASFSLGYVALNTFSSSRTFVFDTDAQPSVGSDGRGVLFAWFQGAESSGGDVVAVRLQPPSFPNFKNGLDQPLTLGAFGPDRGVTRPDIATDGQRYLVVWRTVSAAGDHDIVGAMVDNSGKVTPILIVASGADERDPSVIAVAEGTVLVAYEKISGGERRIAGRFISFTSRRRAAR
jgi:hypothetical protein